MGGAVMGRATMGGAVMGGPIVRRAFRGRAVGMGGAIMGRLQTLVGESWVG